MDPDLPGISNPSATLIGELAAALSARAAQHVARTHHRQEDGSPRYTNRLIRESSPYLLQHAHNPVNWFAWGDEAFARARAEDKLVLLSVGYSTCHWCHVMERESFEDEEIASFINAHYIPVKVDREERPDVDSVYMVTVQMMTGRGGWPMTVILNADGKPIFGGTYFPPRDGDRGARTGFLTLLEHIEGAKRSARDELEAQAEEVATRLREARTREPPSEVPSAFAIRDTVVSYSLRFDSEWGGFGPAPKFPRSAILELLSRYYCRTRDPGARDMMETTLEKMAWGGMYDQAGGGFHRYSTDAQWLVPHFEKMLYDNAQLVVSYIEGWQHTKRDDFARVAREVCDYVIREMTHERGGFFSATDADSETPSGETREGWFFTWSLEELREALSGDALRVVEARYEPTEDGNFEGRNVFRLRRPDAETARIVGLSTTAFRQALDDAHRRLYAERAKRPAPLRDEKIITAWNGLMVSGLARAGGILEASDLTVAATRGATFLFDALWDGEQLSRSWLDGRVSGPGFLDDYAFVIQACLDLLEVSGDGEWLARALELQSVLDREFWDDECGGYWYTASSAEALLVREKPRHDGAEPSGNSVAVKNLLRLFGLTDEAVFRERAERSFAALGRTLDYAGPAVPALLSALDLYLGGAKQIVLSEGEGREALAAVLRETPVPNAVRCAADTPGVAWSAGKGPVNGRAAAYVCEEGHCARPATEPATLREQLAAVMPLFRERVPRLRVEGAPE